MEYDGTYTPLRNSFNELVERAFAPGMTEAQKDTLKMVFMAGAASAVGLLKDNPGNFETVFDELVDKTERWGVPQPTKVA